MGGAGAVPILLKMETICRVEAHPRVPPRPPPPTPVGLRLRPAAGNLAAVLVRCFPNSGLWSHTAHKSWLLLLTFGKLGKAPWASVSSSVKWEEQWGKPHRWLAGQHEHLDIQCLGLSLARSRGSVRVSCRTIIHQGAAAWGWHHGEAGSSGLGQESSTCGPLVTGALAETKPLMKSHPSAATAGSESHRVALMRNEASVPFSALRPAMGLFEDRIHCLVLKMGWVPFPGGLVCAL